MTAKRTWTTPAADEPLPVTERGYELIRDPLLNKGTAFTPEERRALGLEGLLPSRVNNLEQQVRRNVDRLAALSDPLNRYLGLADLQDRNEQLFYRVLTDNLEEFMPIVYTPTVGRATREFSHVFRRGRGVWITPDHRGRFADILRAGANGRDIRLLVATDNQSILGIGDQGAGGMAISIGKLSLYCAGAGIHPGLTLPVCLDVGTNNVSLLDDHLYLGWPHRRLRGEEYYEFIDEFAEAVAEVFPNALLQWEDFRALTILDRYRSRLLSFNDDIQGTGAVCLAGIQAAMRKLGAKLEDQRFLIHGAGAAGLGIARQIRAGLAAVGGDPWNVLALDSRGLLVEGESLSDAYKSELAVPAERAAELGFEPGGAHDLLSVVRGFRPTVLIGTSGQPGAFNREIVEAVAASCEHPVIMPFSNPTDYSEARPVEVIEWTAGKALVATGSPFADVEYEGRRFRVGQGNNVFIFPGLGLGALLSGAPEVSDGMIGAAADAVAGAVTTDELGACMLYPSVRRLRDVCHRVAAAVMKAAAREGLGEPLSSEDIDSRIAAAVWQPEYRTYLPA
jgi:malate dehydrogenase (oxaloacetate-decarboxylating)